MKRSFAGSHPEEQYSPATRQKMFLDRPTSHGGWPEGEDDPPVGDRIYGWYKKMKMMPEGEEPEMRAMRSSEQRRDLQKDRHGRKLGYTSDPEDQQLASDLALRLMSPEGRGNALEDVMQKPRLAMNVWSELQSAGEYALAKLIRPIADEYVNQRGKGMRITESMLRRIIREEYSRLNEAEIDEAAAEAAVKNFFRVKNKEFPGPAKNTISEVTESARSACKYELAQAGVTDIAFYVRKYAPPEGDMGEAYAVSMMQ